MNTQRVLAAEYIVALAFSSWGAVKDNQMPWPPTVVKTSLAFAILGILSVASTELATILGVGFLVAQLIKILEGKTPYTGGAPHNSGDGHGVPTETIKGGKSNTLVGILSFNNTK